MATVLNQYKHSDIVPIGAFAYAYDKFKSYALSNGLISYNGSKSPWVI